MKIVDEHSFWYSIAFSKRNTKIRITIENGIVKVIAPSGIPLEFIRKFVKSKEKEILKKICEQKSKDFKSGECLTFMGQQYKARIVLNSNKKEILGPLDGEILINLTDTCGDVTGVKELLRNWYILQAKVLFLQKLRYYSGLMSLRFKNYKIKSQKTQWGSCSKKGNINLNWRLILAPEEVIDYVIIHELAHLKYFNHSSDFWCLVSQVQPDYMKCKEWLKINGKHLIM